MRHDIKNVKFWETKYKDFNSFLEYTNDLIKYKCLRCNKNYQITIDQKLKERFPNNNANKFILRL